MSSYVSSWDFLETTLVTVPDNRLHKTLSRPNEPCTVLSPQSFEKGLFRSLIHKIPKHPVCQTVLID